LKLTITDAIRIRKQPSIVMLQIIAICSYRSFSSRWSRGYEGRKGDFFGNTKDSPQPEGETRKSW